MSTEFSSAVAAFRSGQLQRADHLCRQVLVQHPHHHAAINLRGIIASTVGNHAAAVELMQASVAMAPQTEEYRRNLVKALMHEGKLAEAEETLRDAVQRSPESPELLGLWGTVIGQQGNLEAGIETLNKAVESSPNAAANYFNLAGLNLRNRDRAAAISCLEKTLELEPDHADALNNLAGLLLSNGRFMDALSSIERLLQVDPRSVQAYCNLSVLMGAAGDAEAAVTALRNAQKLDPTSPQVRFQLAKKLITAGDLDEADRLMQQLRAAADVEPTIYKVVHARILERKGEIEAAWEIVDSIDEEARDTIEVAMVRATVLEQRGDTESALETLQSAIDANDVAAVDSIGLQFTMGTLYDALGRYDEAFEAFEIGNRNRKKAFFDFDRRDADVSAPELFISIHDPDQFRDVPTATLNSEVPIFVIGMPRSGTSLVEQILASHSQVYGAGELTAFRSCVRDTYDAQEKPPGPLQIIDSDPSVDQRCLVPKDWNSITAEQLNDIASNYLQFVSELGGDAARVTDKMPYNYLMAPVISKVFPKGRIIHCRRHPLDTCISCFFQNFTGGNQYAYDLTDLGEFYRGYLQIMAHSRDALDVPMLELDYEQLVHDPEPHVRKLLDFVELDWEADCLSFHQSTRVVRTASYQQVRKPIYTQSAGRWKHYEPHLGPLVDSLGISLEQIEDGTLV